MVHHQSSSAARVSPSANDESKNAYDIFLEGLVLFVAGALGMLLPLLAMTSGSVRIEMVKVAVQLTMENRLEARSDVHSLWKCVRGRCHASCRTCTHVKRRFE